MTTVLVAPDSFKGTMSAEVVAAALAAGVADAGGTALVCPLADGGEGTAAVLATALGGELVTAAVTGPLGDPVRAAFVLTDDGRTAVLDTATASGLHLMPPDRRDAEAATSTGTGELLLAAAATGARRLLLGVGGSACTDGGSGALAAIQRGGGLRGASVVVLCDVRTPYEDAARVFGPQKGADPAAVERLSARLQQLAQRLPRDPRGVLRTGCAGGLSGALWAACDADLVSGIDAVLDAVGFDRLLASADLVLTGEGRLDGQTAHGKVISGVTARAARSETPVWAVVGQSDARPEEVSALGLTGVTTATDPVSLSIAAARLLRRVERGR